MSGKVYLVGAGPGDPGLITVKGRRCIETADVVIYDYLAAPALLEHARPDAELVYVGKKGGEHTLSQEGINALLVEKAMGHAVVTRLKGGDPFIFGRGGEEAEALLAAGIPFEIVPGVTSAVAGPAYAGIPLTHRDYTSSVAFVTGHEDPGKTASAIDWKALATGIGTLVFFMGVKNLPAIVRSLRDNGMPPERPVAVVRWGTTPAQRTVTGTLATIEEAVRSAGIKAPALIVVGEVVNLRPSLQWFENRPLFGKRVVVTRAREQASDLVRRLADLGADCLEVPTIRIEPPAPGGPMDMAIERLAGYDWIIFTSVNGVRFFFERLMAKGLDVRALGHLKTAVIGPATAERLLEFGLKSDIVPETFRAESIVAAFENVPIEGRRILLPRALEARAILPAALLERGAEVDEVAAYHTEIEADRSDSLIEALENRTVSMVTFTSSSTVKNFKALLPPERLEALMEGVTVASIGPITTDTARALGFTVHLTAEAYTIPGLCEAICDFYRA
ncbi:MAG: uroporphyrinogen-III C-methyltransferase [Desulfobacterales bacterium]